MSRKTVQWISLFLALTMILLTPMGGDRIRIRAEAAVKTVLSNQKITLYMGQSCCISIATKKEVHWSVSDNCIASVKRVSQEHTAAVIRAKKAGITVVTARVGTRKYHCTVRVVSLPAVSQHWLLKKETLHSYTSDDIPEWAKYSTGSNTYEYDTAGRLTTETVHDSGSLWCRYLYEYDAQGRKVKESIWYPDDTCASTVTTYAYDADNRLLTETTQDSTGETSYVTCEYNAAGQNCKRTYTFGTLMTSEVYGYDTAGRLSKTILQNSDGSTADEVSRTYDSSGRLIRSTDKRPDGSLYGYSVYQYDSLGNLILKKSYMKINDRMIFSGFDTYTYTRHPQ